MTARQQIEKLLKRRHEIFALLVGHPTPQALAEERATIDTSLSNLWEAAREEQYGGGHEIERQRYYAAKRLLRAFA